MIEWLNSTISIDSLIWLFLVTFMLHDFEEIIRIEPWYKKNYEFIYHRVPKQFKSQIHAFANMTSYQFALAVCFEFILFIPFTFLAAERGSYIPFLGFNAFLLIHVFMHVGQAIFLKKFVPGVATAVVITLPYSVYLFYRLLNESVISWMDIIKGIPYGLLLIVVVLIGHLAGDKLFSNIKKQRT